MRTVYVVLTHGNHFVGVFATRAAAVAEASTGRYLVDEVELLDADEPAPAEGCTP